MQNQHVMHATWQVSWLCFVLYTAAGRGKESAYKSTQHLASQPIRQRLRHSKVVRRTHARADLLARAKRYVSVLDHVPDLPPHSDEQQNQPIK